MPEHAKTWIFFLLCSILAYELPYILTLQKTGWTPLPPVVDYPADQMLYLHLSVIQYSSPQEVINPWYGNRVPALDVPHLRFPVTFRLFHLTHVVFHSWTLAMLVWAGIWAALSYAGAAFCLRSMFPESAGGIIGLGAFGLQVLQSPLVYLAELRKLPSLAGFYELQLPFVRFAFPQVIVAALFAYVGLQTRVLHNGSKWALAGMALLQLAILSAFPYALLVLAVGTAITILIVKLSKRDQGPSWPVVMGFAAICGVLDFGYVWLSGLGRSNGNVRFGLQFRPEMIIPALRPYVLLLLLGAVFALFSRVSLASKATAAGLALSSAVFAFSDVFLPPTSIMLNHVNYLIALTIWFPLVAWLWPWLENLRKRGYVALGSILIAIGFWQAFANYRTSLSINLFHAAAQREVETLALTDRDLMIAPAQFSDDTSCWEPLIAPARVLFTRDAENILSSETIHSEQALRQALYLELTGVTHKALLAFTEPGSPDSRINPIALFGEYGYASSPMASDRVRVRTLIRDRLGRMLLELESNPTSAYRLLRGYDRIVVLDDSQAPRFTQSSLLPWLTIDRTYEHNGTRVWICHPVSIGLPAP
jgi:hypothetical protein